MELNQKQRDTIRQILDAKMGAHTPDNCEMCGHDEWAIDPYIMELREFRKGGLSYESPVIPLISMHCVKCGNTKTFNAISLGAIDERTGAVVEHAGEVVVG